MSNLLAQTLRLRRDTVFLKTDGGIVFRARKGTFALKGKRVYRDFQQLLPYLNGDTTGSELLGSLLEENRRPASEMIQVLLQRGIVQTSDPAEGARLDVHTASVFESQIEFIRHYADKPHERFWNYRETRLLLAGAGTAYSGAGAALLRNGLHTLHLSQAVARHTRPISEECERLRGQGVTSRIELADFGAVSPRFAMDVVLYCSERANLAEIRRLNDRAIKYGFAFLPAYIYGETSIVGPLVTPGQPGCWECAMLRWCDNASADYASRFWRRLALGEDAGCVPRETSEIAANMLGNIAAMEIFKMRAGHFEPESQCRLLKQDLSTMELTIKTIVPHPDCKACGVSARRQVPVSGTAAAATEEKDIHGKLAACFDAETGMLRGYDDEDIDQVPLRLSSVRFACAEAGREQSALGWSLEDSHAARLHAFTKAVRYRLAAAAGAGLRKSLIRGVRGQERVVRAGAILGSLGNAPKGVTPELCLQMRDLSTGEQMVVPAGAVHPEFDHERWFDTQPLGVSAARTLAEAQWEAVLSLCEYRVLAGLAHGSLQAKRLASENEEDKQSTTAYLLSTRRHIGIKDQEIAVFGAGDGVFTALVTSGQVANLIVATRFSLREAVNAVLTESIARAQLQSDGREWRDVALRTGRYEWAELALETEDEISLDGVPQSVPLDDWVAQAAKRGEHFLWMETTPADVAWTGLLRTVKAVLVQDVTA
jgi:bacteriocin biosynthesis cyclodehydratase domain-containing protein